jgi:hypothetical protein
MFYLPAPSRARLPAARPGVLRTSMAACAEARSAIFQEPRNEKNTRRNSAAGRRAQTAQQPIDPPTGNGRSKV